MINILNSILSDLACSIISSWRCRTSSSSSSFENISDSAFYSVDHCLYHKTRKILNIKQQNYASLSNWCKDEKILQLNTKQYITIKTSQTLEHINIWRQFSDFLKETLSQSLSIWWICLNYLRLYTKVNVHLQTKEWFSDIFFCR